MPEDFPQNVTISQETAPKQYGRERQRRQGYFTLKMGMSKNYITLNINENTDIQKRAHLNISKRTKRTCNERQV